MLAVPVHVHHFDPLQGTSPPPHPPPPPIRNYKLQVGSYGLLGQTLFVGVKVDGGGEICKIVIYIGGTCQATA